MKATTSLYNTTFYWPSVVLESPSQVEGKAVCSALATEAVLIVGGNLLTIVLFALDQHLRKRSLFLVINMAFADVMLGAVSLPLYVYLYVGPYYRLWTITQELAPLKTFWEVFDTICTQASLISAVFISCERFYAIYWPLKHRTLSMRTHRIVIFMVWFLAVLVFMITYLTDRSSKTSTFLWITFTLIFLGIVCACNIAIRRKIQQGNIALRSSTTQQNRVSQNQRLTKTLLFVSFIAVLTWLSLVVANFLYFIEKRTNHRFVFFYWMMNIVNFSNNIFNPVIYALKIPAFRRSLRFFCSRHQAVMNSRGRQGSRRAESGGTALKPWMELRTLSTAPSHVQPTGLQAEAVDSKL